MRATSLLLIAVVTVAGPRPARAQLDSANQRIASRADSILLAAVPRGFSGVVRIQKDSTIVLFKGYGLANREQSIPFTAETVVQLGSTTRNFTVAALLRLQARGLLRLTDSMTKYFPAAPPDKQRVTLQHLVNHTAGFPTRLGADDEAISRDEFLRRALETPLKWPPGAQVNTSSVGYALLAAVIEQVTGKAYDEQVRDDLLAPINLTSTGVLLPNFDPNRVEHGYVGGADQGTVLTRAHAPDGLWWNVRGSTGTLSTLGNVHEFYSALLATDKLLTTAVKKRYFDPAAPVKYASVERGTSFLYERSPRQRVEVIIAANSSETDVLQIRIRLGEVIELLLKAAGEVVENGAQAKAKSSTSRRKSTHHKHHFHIGHHHH